jgi:hypothetical protein
LKTNLFFRLPALLLAGLMLVLSAACQASPPLTLDTAAIRAYADPATETLLQGLSANDLARYVQNGNPAFKAAVTAEVFSKVYAQIRDNLGAYASKEFLRAEESQGYIVTHYKAKYAKGEVGVRMVFDSSHLVAGHFFE